MGKSVVTKFVPKWFQELPDYLEETGFDGNIITVRTAVQYIQNKWSDFKDRCDMIFQTKTKEKEIEKEEKKKSKKRKTKDDDGEDNAQKNGEPTKKKSKKTTKEEPLTEEEKQGNLGQFEKALEEKQGGLEQTEKGPKPPRKTREKIEIEDDAESKRVRKYFEISKKILEEYAAKEEDVISLTKDQLIILKNTFMELNNRIQYRPAQENEQTSDDNENDFAQSDDFDDEDGGPRTPDDFYYD